MCGRFNLRTPASDIAKYFLPGLEFDSLPNVAPRYNIAPTQNILCILTQDTSRRLALFRWGLVPSWADDAALGNRMINARSETVAEKPSYRSAFKSRRCIIPADGYYEWQATTSGKQPYEFSAVDGRPLAIAGLWECNKKLGEEGQSLFTCTILTTESNRFTSEVHNRMPVLLSEENWGVWLEPSFDDQDVLKSMLVPASDDYLQMRPVSRRLNNVRNEGEELLVP